MRASLLGCEAPEWEMVLGTAPHDFYQLPAYVALCADQEGARACCLYVTDGERNLLLPLLIRPIPGGGCDAISPYGYPGPIGTGVNDAEFVHLAFFAGQQALREAGLISVFLRFHPLLNLSPPEGFGSVVVHGDTVSIDLTLPAETHWTQTRRGHREGIIRATRLGYSAWMDEEWTHFDAFKRLYRQTMEGHQASSFCFFGDPYFDVLRDALGERLHLCVVGRDDVVVAAGLFAETSGLVEYHLAGDDQEFRRIQPAKLMLHFVRGWANDRGDRVLHLGGGVGSANDSLFAFKAGFSPLRRPFATLRSVIDRPERERLVAAADPHLNPNDLSGFFPQYRRLAAPS